MARSEPLQLLKAQALAGDIVPLFTDKSGALTHPHVSDIERSWMQLRGQRPAHKTFRDADHLDATIKEEIADLDAIRSPHPLANLRNSG